MTLQVTTMVMGSEAPVLPACVVRTDREQIAFMFTFDND